MREALGVFSPSPRAAAAFCDGVAEAHPGLALICDMAGPGAPERLHHAGCRSALALSYVDQVRVAALRAPQALSLVSVKDALEDVLRGAGPEVLVLSDAPGYALDVARELTATRRLTLKLRAPEGEARRAVETAAEQLRAGAAPGMLIEGLNAALAEHRGLPWLLACDDFHRFTRHMRLHPERLAGAAILDPLQELAARLPRAVEAFPPL